MKTTLTKNQTKTIPAKIYSEGGQTYRIVPHLRYDDQCGNGHNTFSITGTIDRKVGDHWADEAGGCIHDDIAKHFPELAQYIKWHGCTSEGPSHYPGNVTYHAGSRDCWGMEKGEFKQHTSRGPRQNNGVEGVPNWVLELPDSQPRDVYSHSKPEPVTLEWKAYGRTGEGKERNFNAARSCAIWPDATDEQLSLPEPELKALLMARLPGLMTEFKAAMESLGFTF